MTTVTERTFIDVEYQVITMLNGGTSLWDSLEKWDATVFLVAGGLLFVTTAINALDVFTPIATQEGILLTIEGATGFGGVVLFFVGLLGLYPRLADAEPRLAGAGLLLAIGPGIFFFGLLVVCSGFATLLDIPSLKALIPSFSLITATILVSFTIALTLFGVCSLRASVPSRTVGGLLLVVAVAWFGFFGAMLIFRYQTPTWVTFLQTTLLAIPIVAIGFRLRAAVEPTGSEESSANPTV